MMKRMSSKSRLNRFSLLAAASGLGIAVTTMTGCTHTQGKEYIFKSDPMGHGPDEYEIYTDRTPRSVHQGENTVRAGVMFLPPVQPLVRTAARQKEVMTALMQFNEKMYNLDERRAKDIVRWLSTFSQEHRGLPPDQPVAIQSALDTMLRSRERAVKASAQATDATSKGQIDEAIVKIDEEIAFFRKYVEERPSKVAEYQRQVDELEAANKRMQMWQSRHVRMTNTVEWTQSTNGSADAELNRALGELADTMTHPDDQTKLEVLAMAVNIGGTDAQALLPRVRVVAADEKINSEVRAFAAKVGQSIESQKG